MDLLVRRICSKCKRKVASYVHLTGVHSPVLCDACAGLKVKP